MFEHTRGHSKGDIGYRPWSDRGQTTDRRQPFSLKRGPSREYSGISRWSPFGVEREARQICNYSSVST